MNLFPKTLDSNNDYRFTKNKLNNYYYVMHIWLWFLKVHHHLN